MKAREQDNLKNKFSALMEEREQETAVILGKETAETLLLVPDSSSSEQEDKVVGELESEAALLSHQKQQALLVSSLQEIKQNGGCAKQSRELRDDNQLQNLQVNQYNEVYGNGFRM